MPLYCYGTLVSSILSRFRASTLNVPVTRKPEINIMPHRLNTNMTLASMIATRLSQKSGLSGHRRAGKNRLKEKWQMNRFFGFSSNASLSPVFGLSMFPLGTHLYSWATTMLIAAIQRSCTSTSNDCASGSSPRTCLQPAHPPQPLYAASLDWKLNTRKYIKIYI